MGKYNLKKKIKKKLETIIKQSKYSTGNLNTNRK